MKICRAAFFPLQWGVRHGRSSSKGLEFPVVFLVNCTTGHFPSSRAVTPKELEEERRIFYVGMTRARKRLYISGYSDNNRKISSFVAEAKVLATETPAWYN